MWWQHEAAPAPGSACCLSAPWVLAARASEEWAWGEVSPSPLVSEPEPCLQSWRLLPHHAQARSWIEMAGYERSVRNCEGLTGKQLSGSSHTLWGRYWCPL